MSEIVSAIQGLPVILKLANYHSRIIRRTAISMYQKAMTLFATKKKELFTNEILLLMHPIISSDFPEFS